MDIAANIKFTKKLIHLEIFGKKHIINLNDKTNSSLRAAYDEIHANFLKIGYVSTVTVTDNDGGMRVYSVFDINSANNMLHGLIISQKLSKFNANKKAILLPNHTKAPSTRF